MYCVKNANSYRVNVSFNKCALVHTDMVYTIYMIDLGHKTSETRHLNLYIMCFFYFTYRYIYIHICKICLLVDHIVVWWPFAWPYIHILYRYLFFSSGCTHSQRLPAATSSIIRYVIVPGSIIDLADHIISPYYKIVVI